MEKEKDVKIEKLVLNLDGDKVSLTITQAKKLKAILDELFGKEIVKEIIEKHHYHDNWYYRPYVTWNQDVYPQWNKDVVYCSNALQINC